MCALRARSARAVCENEKCSRGLAARDVRKEELTESPLRRLNGRLRNAAGEPKRRAVSGVTERLPLMIASTLQTP
jgi:hypothetical protein